MGQGDAEGVGNAVRWLGAPPTVLALVVLALNDHVWKQQWPGVVTGKLSDVAGLVVAPPLLALVLAVGRVRHPAAWALAMTGLGFTLVKSHPAGAEFASTAWSLVTPSSVLRDPTDLLALPALFLAWRVSCCSARAAHGERRTAALALGSLVLPLAVLATAATGQCREHDEARQVTLVEGVFTGETEPRRALIVETSSGTPQRLDDAGQIVALDGADERRLQEGRKVDHACSSSSADCWRIDDPEGLTVERSRDGGATWQEDYSMTPSDRDDIVDRIGERCGEAATVVATDLAVLDGSDGLVVAVTFESGGLLVRGPDGLWRRAPVDIRGLPLATTTTPTSPGTGPSRTGPEDPIVALGGDAAPSDPRDTPSSTGPACTSTTTHVITPDPRNTPETTQTYCRA